MNYVNPKMVKSPKTRLSGAVKVIKDQGENGWTLAEIIWDGNPSLAMRWNGSFDDAGHNIGTPQSRGVPLWFILPDDEDFLKTLEEGIKQVRNSRV